MSVHEENAALGVVAPGAYCSVPARHGQARRERSANATRVEIGL